LTRSRRTGYSCSSQLVGTHLGGTSRKSLNMLTLTPGWTLSYQLECPAEASASRLLGGPVEQNGQDPVHLSGLSSYKPNSNACGVAFESGHFTRTGSLFIVNYSWCRDTLQTLRNWWLQFDWSPRIIFLDLCLELCPHSCSPWWGCRLRTHSRSLSICEAFGWMRRKPLEAQALASAQPLDQRKRLWHWMDSQVQLLPMHWMIALEQQLTGSGLGSDSFSCLVFGIKECVAGSHSSPSAASCCQPWLVRSSEQMDASQRLLVLVKQISLEHLRKHWRELELRQLDAWWMECSLECSSGLGHRRHTGFPSLEFRRMARLVLDHSLVVQTAMLSRVRQSLLAGVFSCQRVAGFLCSFLVRSESWSGWRSSEWQICVLGSLIWIYCGISLVFAALGMGSEASLESGIVHRLLDQSDGWWWNPGSYQRSFVRLAGELIGFCAIPALVEFLMIQSSSIVVEMCMKLAFKVALCLA